MAAGLNGSTDMWILIYKIESILNMSRKDLQKKLKFHFRGYSRDTIIAVKMTVNILLHCEELTLVLQKCLLLIWRFSLSFK